LKALQNLLAQSSLTLGKPCLLSPALVQICQMKNEQNQNRQLLQQLSLDRLPLAQQVWQQEPHHQVVLVVVVVARQVVAVDHPNLKA
jgi:hypothetical protein